MQNVQRRKERAHDPTHITFSVKHGGRRDTSGDWAVMSFDDVTANRSIKIRLYSLVRFKQMLLKECK